MRILVTGAGGFIGSHLVESLVRGGYEVRALVRYNSAARAGWLDQLPSEICGAFETVFGDVRDEDSVEAAVRGTTAVLNLAALIGIPYSYEAPSAYVATNIQGTLNLLKAARRVGVSRFVQTSTSEVYGTAQRVPIDENHPLVGQSPYSATKIGADALAVSFWASFEQPVVIIRPFNTYGPRQSLRAVIPTVVAQVAARKRQIKLGALTPTRDFNFVEDTVSGFIAALGAPNCVGETINLGTGYEVSIADLVKIIGKVMGQEIEPIQDEQRLRPQNSEVERLIADNSKAQRLLGWKPQYTGPTGFEAGIAKTARWFTVAENLALYDADAYRV